MQNLQTLAQSGNVEAQNELGWMYETGKGVPLDYQQAAIWFQKAAAQGHADAQFKLAFMYENGKGVPRNHEQAFLWLKQAGEQGSYKAQLELASRYEKSKSIEKAAYWYNKATEQDDAKAQFNLGQKYANGQGVPQDDEQAVYWFRKAAEKGHPGAQFNLVQKYAKGDGVIQDTQLAKEWLHKAMDVAEDGRGFSKIGDAFQALHDYHNADLCYQKAIDAGYSHDLLRFRLSISQKYAKGDGVTQDTQLAKEWLHKAINVAKTGDEFDSIGNAFKALHDYSNAVLCYQKAAENNDFDSHLTLSKLYATGDGVTQDTQLAKEWLHKAMDVAEGNWKFSEIGDAFKALHDYPNAVLCYEKAAENNDFDSHLTLSKLYATGDGVTQDTQLAKEWLHKAINVAEDGWDFERVGDAFKALHDYPNAVLCYQKALENNHFDSHFTLSNLYATGDGVMQDTQLAKEWLRKAMGVAESAQEFKHVGDAFKALHDYPNAVLCYQKAAENDHFSSHLILSNLYATGDGVTQDTQLAKEWLHKAIDVAEYGGSLNKIGDAFKALHDYPNAVLCYQKAAENNYFYSHLTLSELYATGDGVTQDTQLAKEWLHKAMDVAEYGGNLNKIGDAFKALHDYPNAVLCYQKAAKNNYFDSHLILSNLYATGDGVTQDTQLAKEWLHKAIDVAKSGWDFKKIGDAFKTLRDYPNAVLWYQKAVENNVVDGHLALSNLYATGDGVTQDTQLAKEWLHKAAMDVAKRDGRIFIKTENLKHAAKQQEHLGNAFKALHDYPNAVLWYQKAAEKNDANAQFGLGELYENGQGVTQDEEQAVLWYQKAAEQNHEAAQTALERIKARNANANTPKTNRQKVSEYRKAAEQGDALAQFHLGQMYESGKGIPQNYVLAYAWLSVAVANEISEPTDHELAIQLRDEVGQKLPPHALSEAQQLAAQYFEQYAADE